MWAEKEEHINIQANTPLFFFPVAFLGKNINTESVFL